MHVARYPLIYFRWILFFLFFFALSTDACDSICIDLFPVNFRKLWHDSFTEVCPSKVNFFFKHIHSHYVSVESRLIHVTRHVWIYFGWIFFFPPFFGLSTNVRASLCMYVFPVNIRRFWHDLSSDDCSFKINVDTFNSSDISGALLSILISSLATYERVTSFYTRVMPPLRNESLLYCCTHERNTFLFFYV